MPNNDGEFYQFCYVTHKGEIRGASTPFLFRANSPSEDELLTVEDECNSDILVVTTKAGFLEVPGHITTHSHVGNTKGYALAYNVDNRLHQHINSTGSYAICKTHTIVKSFQHGGP